MDDISSSQQSLTSSQETEDDHDAEEYDFENFSNEDHMDYLARHFPYIAAQVIQNDPEASEGCKHKGQPANGDALLFTSPESSNEEFNAESGNNTCLLGLPSVDLGGCFNGTKSMLNDNESSSYLIGHEDVSENEALVDSLLISNTANIEDDVYNFDINSGELQKFIYEFEAISKYDEHLSKYKRKRHSKNRNGTPEKQKNGEHTNDWQSTEGSPQRIKAKFSKTKQLKILVANLLKSSRIYRTNEQTEKKTESESAKCDAILLLNGESATQKDNKQKTIQTCRMNGTEKQLGSLPGTKNMESSQAKSKPQDNQGKQMSNEQAHAQDNHSEQMSKERLLVKATMHGDLNKMKYYLDSNESLCNISDLKGNTLLHVAAKFGQLECLQYLLARVSPDLLQRENNDCLTPTALAVKHGQQICMEWLVSETSSVAELEVQDNRWSMLHISARYGQESCLRWLLSYMLNEDLTLDVLDNKGNTPAHLAAKYGHLHCVQTLVEFNQDITLFNKKQQTPCALALKHRFSSCAQFLVVVEVCSMLSDQVVRLQRELREIEQENTVITSRLEDAVACTDGLIQMQKTDLMKKVDEVRTEYKSLTSMLIKKLDMMHLQGKDSRTPNCSAQAKEKADMLSDVCDCLVSEGSNRQSPEGSELQKIESTIERIQQPYPRPSVSVQPHQPMNLLRNKLKEVSLQILKVQSAKTDEDKKVWGMKNTSGGNCPSTTQNSTQASVQSSPPLSTDVRQRHSKFNSGCHMTWKHQSQSPSVQNLTEYDSATDKFYSGSSQKIEAKTASIVTFTGKPSHSPQSSGSSSSSLGLGPKVSKSEMRGERLRTYFAKKSSDEDCKTYIGEVMPLDSDHDSISHELASQLNYNKVKTTCNGIHSRTSQTQNDSPIVSPGTSPAVSFTVKDIYKKSRPAPMVEKIDNSTENLHRIFARHLPANKYTAIKQMPDYLRRVQTTKPQNRKLIKIDVDGEMMLSTVVEEHQAMSDSTIVSTTSCDVLFARNGNSSNNNHVRSGILTPPGEPRKKSKDRHITFAIDEKTLFKEQNHEAVNNHNLFFNQQENKFEQRNTVHNIHFTRSRPVEKTSSALPPRKIRSNDQLSEDNLRIANGLTDEVGGFGELDSTWNESVSDETQPRAWYDSSDEEVERKHQEKHESYL